MVICITLYVNAVCFTGHYFVLIVSVRLSKDLEICTKVTVETLKHYRY